MTRQTDRRRDKQTVDGGTNRQMAGQTDRRRTNRQTAGQTDRRWDKQTDRPMVSQRNKHTNENMEDRYTAMGRNHRYLLLVRNRLLSPMILDVRLVPCEKTKKTDMWPLFHFKYTHTESTFDTYRVYQNSELLAQCNASDGARILGRRELDRNDDSEFTWQSHRTRTPTMLPVH